MPDFHHTRSRRGPAVGLAGWVYVCACLAPQLLAAQTLRYSGTVVDEAKAPVGGADLRVQGTALATRSGADGSFLLTGDASASAFPVGRGGPRPWSGDGARYLADGRSPGNLHATVPYLLRRRDPNPGVDRAGPGAKRAATRILLASKAGYVTGNYREFSDNGRNLTLTLYGNPSASAYAEARQACLDTVNALRAGLGLKALARSAALEAFADSGAHYDSDHNHPHAHFDTQKGNTLVAFAENELPGWGYNDYASLARIIREGVKMMWAEGPGGGHYENIKGAYTQFGCGFFINADGEVWATQDFR